MCAAFGWESGSNYLKTPTYKMKPLPSWAKQLDNGRTAVYLDNHLLSTFTECERKFNYRHIGRYVQKGTGDRSATMELGIWWSETLERFYRGMMDYQNKVHGSTEPSDITLVKAAGEAWHNLHMSNDGEGEASFEERYPSAFQRFGGDAGAIFMAKQYWDAFGEWDTRHWKIIAMELGFGLGNEVLLFEDNELAIYWCGRPDLIVYENQTDQLMVVDHKTTEYMKSNFIQKWKPHGQTCGYVHALNILCKDLGYNREVDRCVINGAGRLVAKKPDKKSPPRFLRPRPHYSFAEVQEWIDQVVMRVRDLLDAYNEDIWKINDKACHIYAGCIYRGVCNQPPDSRLVVLESSYNIVEPWVPYHKTEEEGEE